MMIGMETVPIAALIFVLVYRFTVSPRALLNRITGWMALALCVVGIPAGIFGAISFLDSLRFPAIVIFVALCIVWLLLVPA